MVANFAENPTFDVVILMKPLHVPEQISLVVEARVVFRAQLTIEGLSRLLLFGTLCSRGLIEAVA